MSHLTKRVKLRPLVFQALERLGCAPKVRYCLRHTSRPQVGRMYWKVSRQISVRSQCVMGKWYPSSVSLLSLITLFHTCFTGRIRVPRKTTEEEESSGSDWIGHPFFSASVATMFSTLVSGISAVAMMIGGAVPYVPQYRAIKQNQNAEGFSTYVCLSLFIANILRIMFWFGKPFELPLLIQSFIMIGAMLLMLRLVVSVRQRTGAAGTNRKHFRDMNLNAFWQWTDFQSYVEFLACFSTFCVMLYFMFGSNQTFVEAIGFMAVFTEAVLGVPQFYRNWQNKSTAGMSVAMVAMWTSGDIFKTTYFIVRNAPVQFAICGTLQVLIDIAILLQVYFYGPGGSSKSFKELPKDNFT